MIANLSADAQQELIDGALFYAREANREVGLAFISEFEHALDLLCRHPRLGAVWRGDTRRFPLRRFPYSILNHVKPNEIRIIAIAHQRRRPGYWEERS